MMKEAIYHEMSEDKLMETWKQIDTENHGKKKKKENRTRKEMTTMCYYLFSRYRLPG
jgi:hypothetical protein